MILPTVYFNQIFLCEVFVLSHILWSITDDFYACSFYFLSIIALEHNDGLFE